MNSANVSGHLGRDTTAIFGEGTAKRALFQVASNRKYTDKDGKKQTATNWIPCIAWGVLADLMEKYGLKGRHVEVTGSLDCYQKPVNADGSYDPQSVQLRVATIEFTQFEDNVRDLVEKEKATATAGTNSDALAKALIDLLNKGATPTPAPVPEPTPAPEAQTPFSPEQLAGLMAALQTQPADTTPPPPPPPAPEPTAQEKAAALLASMVG